MFILTNWYLYFTKLEDPSLEKRRKRKKKARKYISLEEVSLHTEKDDIWMVIHDKVYDVSTFLPRHPGGIEVMLDCGGVDATSYFEDVGHSEYSKQLLKPLYKGEVSLLDRKSVHTEAVSSESDDDGYEEQDYEENDNENNHVENLSADEDGKGKIFSKENIKNINFGVTLLTLLLCLTNFIKLLLNVPNQYISRLISTNKAHNKARQKGKFQKSLLCVRGTLNLENVSYIILFLIAIVSGICYAYLQKRKLEL